MWPHILRFYFCVFAPILKLWWFCLFSTSVDKNFCHSYLVYLLIPVRKNSKTITKPIINFFLPKTSIHSNEHTEAGRRKKVQFLLLSIDADGHPYIFLFTTNRKFINFPPSFHFCHNASSTFSMASFQPPVVGLIWDGHLDRQSFLLATLPEDSCWVGFFPPVDAQAQNFSRQYRECLLTATKPVKPQLPTLTRLVDDLLQFSSPASFLNCRIYYSEQTTI